MLSDLNDEQWSYKPARGGWSIAECLEHVVVVENLSLGRLESAIANGLNTEVRAITDEFILEKIPARSAKFEAPDFSLPSGRWASKEELLDQFHRIRSKTLAMAKRTDVKFREVAFAHPRFGNLDGHQWLLVMSSHCARHLNQIAEIQADPGYPA
jgi:hypothetical protein